MRIKYTKDFEKSFKSLPAKIKLLFRKQESIFKNDPRDPRLHVKMLSGNTKNFSFRVTRKYRVIFTFVESEMVIFYEIGHRKDIYE